MIHIFINTPEDLSAHTVHLPRMQKWAIKFLLKKKTLFFLFLFLREPHCIRYKEDFNNPCLTVKPSDVLQDLIWNRFTEKLCRALRLCLLWSMCNVKYRPAVRVLVLNQCNAVVLTRRPPLCGAPKGEIQCSCNERRDGWLNCLASFIYK